MDKGMEIDDILQEFEEKSKEQNIRSSKFQDDNIYNSLIAAMLNERMSPEILPYQKDLMRKVLEHLSNQQQYLLDSHEYGDLNLESGIVSGDFKLQLMIMETDIERVNYLVRLYLRTRLSKLDKFTLHYINETSKESSPLLSEEEKDYMHKHFKILTELYNNCFLKKMPEYLTYLDDTSGGKSMISIPDLNVPVFIKSVSKEPIIIHSNDDNDDDLEIVLNGIYVVKYSLVKKYIELGDIVLI
ncbi:uncharacterized protein PRCAT00003178001 [Priceomyces carsonii]|uniref:uncharacterized protein n=1 Tax=Priceomyces carsonii TaxID=28549 RepID=UPI002ED9E93A|nr:unnamed protein product [Priceomyces carsonii]